jgi:hypothetical protein
MSENAHDFHSKLLPSKKTFRILWKRSSELLKVLIFNWCTLCFYC